MGKHKELSDRHGVMNSAYRLNFHLGFPQAAPMTCEAALIFNSIEKIVWDKSV